MKLNAIFLSLFTVAFLFPSEGNISNADAMCTTLECCQDHVKWNKKNFFGTKKNQLIFKNRREYIKCMSFAAMGGIKTPLPLNDVKPGTSKFVCKSNFEKICQHMNTKFTEMKSCGIDPIFTSVIFGSCDAGEPLYPMGCLVDVDYETLMKAKDRGRKTIRCLEDVLNLYSQCDGKERNGIYNCVKYKNPDWAAYTLRK